MAALSTADELTFRADGTYDSTHRSASTIDGATRFDVLDYRARSSVSDWTVPATNRVDGKPQELHARFEPVRNGTLLVLTDSDGEPLSYVLFRRAGRRRPDRMEANATHSKADLRGRGVVDRRTAAGAVGWLRKAPGGARPGGPGRVW